MNITRAGVRPTRFFASTGTALAAALAAYGAQAAETTVSPIPPGGWTTEVNAAGHKAVGGDQENEDVGQGTVTASPLQMAVAYAALANGGTVFEPRVAKAIVSPSGEVIKRIKAPVRGHIPLSPSELSYLKSCFYYVTEQSKGTAYSAFTGFPMSQVEVAGKTGTAELPNTQENDSWFVSFGGPTGEKPQFVTVI